MRNRPVLLSLEVTYCNHYDHFALYIVNISFNKIAVCFLLLLFRYYSLLVCPFIDVRLHTIWELSKVCVNIIVVSQASLSSRRGAGVNRVSLLARAIAFVPRLAV